MVSFPKGTGPSAKTSKAKSETRERVKAKAKVKKKPMFKTYLVGLCITAFRQNLMIKVKANNDYCALLGAMKKLRAHVADMYPSKRDMVEENWEAEEKELCARFKTYDALKDYLCVAGFIVTTPYVLVDPHVE